MSKPFHFLRGFREWASEEGPGYWVAVVGYYETRVISELSHSASCSQSSGVTDLHSGENWRLSLVPTMSNADAETQEQRPLLRASSNSHDQIVAGIKVFEGMPWSMEQLVDMRWEWISFPALLLVGGLILLSATVAQSRKNKTLAWKSSALALLLHGLMVAGLIRVPCRVKLKCVRRN